MPTAKKAPAKKAPAAKKAAPKKKAVAGKPPAAPHACPTLSEQLAVLKDELRPGAKMGDAQAAKVLAATYCVLAHLS
jgi:hypothetical protein